LPAANRVPETKVITVSMVRILMDFDTFSTSGLHIEHFPGDGYSRMSLQVLTQSRYSGAVFGQMIGSP
jgi:hypothetical protein